MEHMGDAMLTMGLVAVFGFLFAVTVGIAAIVGLFISFPLWYAVVAGALLGLIGALWLKSVS